MDRPTLASVVAGVVLAAILVILVGIAIRSGGDKKPDATSQAPATLQESGQIGILQITLTASAAHRLDIQTTAVTAAGGQLAVPSAAVIIDPEGLYWVYTNPEPLVFVRQELRDAREVGLITLFTPGPPRGTTVVVSGVPELYGAEYGIGK